MDLIEDIPPVSNSIWPYDTDQAPDINSQSSYNKLRFFVLCPFTRAGTDLFFIKQAAKNIEPEIKHSIDVYFAGDFLGSGAIHPAIWNHIKRADIIIADITGYNPNVLYELGIAASWRPIDNVIIIRDESDGQTHAFDLQPARQILYDSRKLDWIDGLVKSLYYNIWPCLSKIPFRDEPKSIETLPFRAKYIDGRDTNRLWSPGPSHHRLAQKGLEFGSPYFYPYSWLSLAGIQEPSIHINAEMCFLDSINPEYWMGIALRSQGFLANNEHLIWLSSDGKVMRTGPGKNGIDKDEQIIGELDQRRYKLDEFIPFDIQMDDKVWSIKVGNVENSILLTELPWLFRSGRIMFQTFLCRSIIKNVIIKKAKKAKNNQI